MSKTEQLLARTAKRKAAGLIPVYTGQTPRPIVRTERRAKAPPVAPCVHRGEPTGEAIQCPTCEGNVALKVLACTVHGECTVAKKVDGKACCQGCPDYAPPSPPASTLSASPR